ncbi:MAG: carboxypeptidase regulatory-like domain-containing protein, partial [Gemmatimonadales bacterium]
SLQGTVRASDGELLSGAAVTIEDQGGGTVREIESGDNGDFAVRMMLPGTYNILIEIAGFQPVRLRGVVVAAGRTTSLAVDLQRRPPPITSVTEIVQSGTSAGPIGRVVLERELRTLDYRTDATDLSRGLSEVAAPTDGRFGFAQMASGLPGSFARLYVDGAPETLLRHPGVPADPAIAAGFPRPGVTQAQVSGGPVDGEWRGNPGSVVSLITRSGTNRFEFAPYVQVSSSKLGGNSALNPADSSGTSFWAGASVRGPIKPDTAHFFVSGNYQSVELPSAYPWQQDEATFQGVPISAREAVQTIAQERYSTEVGPFVAPAVRTWKGGSGLGRLDWRVSSRSSLMVRAGGAAFKETSPILGSDAGNDAGGSLSGRDLSAAVSFTTMGAYPNEFRAGVTLSRRDWKAATLPATRLAAEGIRFGGNPSLPGLFETQLFSVSDALHYLSGNHAIKGGVSLDYLNYRQQYHYGNAGVFGFGDLDRFNAGVGTFFRTGSTLTEAKVGAPVVGVFLQDNWRVSPQVDLLLGLRYETQILPRNRIAANANWQTVAGISNDSFPVDRRGFQPRLGFVITPSASNWTLQGGVGLYAGALDLATFAEAVQNSGSNIRVSRVVGNLSWPTAPSATEPPTLSTRLTMFGGRNRYRAPRTLKADAAILGSLGKGLGLRLSGAYHHSDYLLRRTDANLAAFPSGEAQDGRPVWGTLVQQGGLVTVTPGTSRRFSEFDLVSVLSPTGYSDYWEATVSLTRPVGALSLAAEYTFSRTRDNLVGLLAADPADQLSPFPSGIDGADWDVGRSDLDIPHRAAITMEYRSGGRHPISLAARGRWRSGLPFTPGFRTGVDVNGDLGTGNDPAPADAVANPSGPGVIATCDGSSVSGFAARNSCRENSVGSIDLRVGVPLPVGGAQRIVLTIDAFNLVASTTGVVDRAALLINRTGTLTFDPSTGATTIPYVANPNFGTLLRRGGEPRMVRLGLHVEY